MKKMKNFFTKFICFSLIFTMLPITPIQPTTVRADNTGGHKSYFVETLLNSEGGYQATVHTDSTAFGDSLEEQTMKKVVKQQRDDAGDEEAVYLDWRQYSVASIDGIDTAGLDPFLMGTKLSEPTTTKGKLDDTSGLIFSFPSNERGVNAGKNGTATYSKDQERAINVSDTLVKNLNSIIGALKGRISLEKAGVKNTYLSEIKDAGSDTKIADAIYFSGLINPAIASASDYTFFKKVSVGTLFDIYYAKPHSEKYQNFLDTGEMQLGFLPDVKERSLYEAGTNFAELPIIDAQGNLLMYILPYGTDEIKSSEYFTQGKVWAIPKGYLNPLDGTVLGIDSRWGLYGTQSSDNQGDAAWITMFSLAEYANAQALHAGYTTAQAANQETNFIEDSIYNIIMGVYSGLLTILQLNTITELIYEKGAMTDAWWSQVLKYHLIFQIVAWMMLIVAVAKILIQINFSTVNPTIKMSIMDTGQKLLTVGFALALCIPFIRMLEDLNYLIVNIFKTQAINEGQVVAGIGIAGIVILLGYFSITFTMNCIYLMRAIMIALLTASAPLFIVSMAFSGPKQKGLLDNWLKEISANIFMQAIHAFTFAFLWDIMDNSRILVRLVIYFSLLPIVDSFRSLIFGQSGSFATSHGQKAGQQTLGFIESRGMAQAKGAIGSKMKSSALNNQLPVDTSVTGGGEGTTAGETKGSRAGADLSTNSRNIGTAVYQQGDGLFKDAKGIGKEGSKLHKVTKAAGDSINKHTKGGTFAAAAANAALKLGANALDNFEAAGGFTNNAVAKANRGDAGGSVEASQKHAAYVNHATERNLANVGSSVRNVNKALQESKMMDLSNDLAEVNQEILDATSAGNHGALPELYRKQEKLNNKIGGVHSKYQKGRQSGVSFYKKGNHVSAIMDERELSKNMDETYNLSRATYDMWDSKQQEASSIKPEHFGDRDFINIGYGSKDPETSKVTFLNFDQQIANQAQKFGNSNMNEFNQKQLDKQTTAVNRMNEDLGLEHNKPIDKAKDKAKTPDLKNPV